MNLNIMNAGILLSIGVLTMGQAVAQDASKLPPSPLQLLIDKGASQKTDLKLGDLENIFRNHQEKLFSDDLDMNKFLLLQEWCVDLKKHPQAKSLQPLLLKEISTRKAIDRPPVGWDEIMISSHGGDIGLLMECVISISGEAGFNQIFESVVSANDAAKLKILLAQVVMRRERAKYDAIVETKMKTLTSSQLQEVIGQYLNAAAGEK